jgi:hypothetical protein
MDSADRPSPNTRRGRITRDGLLLTGIIFTAFWCWSILQVPFDADTAIYWTTPLDDPYTGARIGGFGAYLYSPLFLQLMAPFRLLPWEAYHVVWTLILLGCLVWLVGRWTPLALLLPPVTAELLVGNVNLLIAVAVVVGVRRGAAWSFPLLTKVLPGGGLLWLVVRQRWREVAACLVLTGGLVAVSFAISPGLWFAWTDALLRSALHPDTRGLPFMALLPVPLWIHLPIGLGLIVVAARRGWAWLMPVAVYLTLPALWVSSLVILLGIPRLWRGPIERQATPTRARERSATAAAPSS